MPDGTGKEGNETGSASFAVRSWKLEPSEGE
jgi:hypothetical protein